MKKYLIIAVLSIIASINAIYLTNLAYTHNSSFCDISEKISCTTALSSPDLIFFGLPFPAIALAVYPIIFLIAMISFSKKWKKGFSWLRALSIGGILFNSYVIFHEYKIGAFCLLCAICSIIIISIFIMSHLEIKKHKSLKES